MAYEPNSDKYSAIGSSAGYPSPAREEATFPSLLKRMENMVANSNASLSIATEIRSRICGSRPEPSRDEKQNRPTGNGVLEEMQLLIDALGQNLERLQDMQNAVFSRIT